ncbi:MAG: sugar ABC transporter ATP-binding protein, partial [Alphaproteobacteria bacterium]|nr:sugar ABC transporter ATP-binding protein [Alphaproteobacteria bacterium]
AEEGAAILLITSDLPEMVDVADRVLVMDGYRIRGEVENNRNYEHVSTAVMGLIHGHKTA